MRRILLLLVASTTLLLAGCATDKRNDALISTLNAYASTVRWNGLESALQFVDPAVLKKHPPSQLDIERYEQLRVSDYDSGNGPAPLSDDEVQQTVQIGLINIHTQAERTIVDRQTWRYDEKTKHWWLVSGLPDIAPN